MRNEERQTTNLPGLLQFLRIARPAHSHVHIRHCQGQRKHDTNGTHGGVLEGTYITAEMQKKME